MAATRIYHHFFVSFHEPKNMNLNQGHEHSTGQSDMGTPTWAQLHGHTYMGTITGVFQVDPAGYMPTARKSDDSSLRLSNKGIVVEIFRFDLRITRSGDASCVNAPALKAEQAPEICALPSGRSQPTVRITYQLKRGLLCISPNLEGSNPKA